MKRVFVLISCIHFQFMLLAQSVVEVGQFEGKLSNVSIVQSIKSPRSVFALAGLVFFASKDGGKTWQRSEFVPTNTIVSPPLLITDAKGSLYIFYCSASEGKPARILCNASHNSGQTWEQAAEVGVVAELFGEISASTDSKGNLYVIWAQKNQGTSGCTTTIHMSTSGNGKKWEAPILMSTQGGSCNDEEYPAHGPTVSVSKDKKMYAAWNQDKKIVMDRSLTGGSYWLSNDISVVSRRGPYMFTPNGWGKNVPGKATLMVDQSKSVSAGVLYLTYADFYEPSKSDILFVRSVDFGDHWTMPLQVNTNNSQFQFMPQMTIDPSSGYIHIVYLDEKDYADGRLDVVLATSTDSGSSFRTRVVSEEPLAPQTEMLPGVSVTASNGVIVCAWTSFADGKLHVNARPIEEPNTHKK